MKRKQLLIVALVVAAVVIYVAQDRLQAAADRAAEAPMFEVDPFWPQPLPNHWVLGSVVGVGVDSRDHVFIVHRQAPLNERTEIGAAQDPPTGECCVPAPYVLEFDPEGNLVNSWGGPGEGYTWPASNHGITVDPMDNIWIGGNGADSHVLKFSRDGEFLASTARWAPTCRTAQHQLFGRVAKVAFDAAANEAYLADGYSNKRVAVLTSTPAN